MGTTTLVEADIKKGEDVLKALDSEGVKVKSAFWIYQPSSSDWQLRLTVPRVDAEGTHAVYRSVRRALEKQDIDIPVWTIQVVGTSDELSKRLRTVVRTKANEVSGIRFSHNRIEDTYIEDAYIYRST